MPPPVMDIAAYTLQSIGKNNALPTGSCNTVRIHSNGHEASGPRQANILDIILAVRASSPRQTRPVHQEHVQDYLLILERRWRKWLRPNLAFKGESCIHDLKGLADKRAAFNHRNIRLPIASALFCKEGRNARVKAEEAHWTEKITQDSRGNKIEE